MVVPGPGPDRWLTPELDAAVEVIASGVLVLGGRVGHGSARMTAGARPVRAPRGTALTCKGWPQEAAMRMLMNNLDPDVAERPDDLVVYGGTGRAARSWAAFDALVATLRTLEADETMLVQSGKPVGVFRTHEWAPRVLIANSNLVPDWATWEEFRRLEALGLTMYGQMTAGSWIYIGTQGILQGTYECFAEIARRRFGGSLRGTITLTAGLGGMGGAQPLAITMNDGVALCVEVDGHRIERRLETRYLDEVAASLDDAVDRCHAAKAAGRAVSIGVLGNAADVVPRLLDMGFDADIVTDQTSAHDPLSYVPNDLSPEAAEELRNHDPDEYVRRSRQAMAAHCEAMVGFLDAGAEVFDYGNSLRAEADARWVRPGLRLSGLPSCVHPSAVLRGQGTVPMGRAVGRSGRHRRDRPCGARGAARGRAPRSMARPGE